MIALFIVYNQLCFQYYQAKAQTLNTVNSPLTDAANKIDKQPTLCSGFDSAQPTAASYYQAKAQTLNTVNSPLTDAAITKLIKH